MKKILIVGPYLDLSGYSHLVHYYYKTLTELGNEVTVFPISWQSPTFRKEVDISIVETFQTNKEFDIVFLITLPLEYLRWKQELEKRGVKYRKCIGVCTLECFPWNKEWCIGCNTVDSLWVLSEFDYVTAINSGAKNVKIKMPNIKFLPFQENKIQTETDFNFLFIGQITNGDRKNVAKLIQVFAQTFRDKNIGLLLKVFMRDNSLLDAKETEEWIKEIYTSKSKLPSIEFIHGILDDEQLANLYAASDCYVSLAHGEGLGLPILEAVNFGIPIIAPFYSGYTTYLNRELGLFTDYTVSLVRPITNVYKDGFWCDPNLEQISENMKRVVEMDKIEIDSLGNLQKQYMLSKLEEYKIIEEDLKI